MPTHNNSSAPRLSVSTWSLHRTLGAPPICGVADGDSPAPLVLPDGALSLLDLPQRLADFGIHTLEICHFHLASREASYLKELRAALDAAEVQLFSFLVDDGDITHETNRERDLKWTEGCIETASILGAQCVRVSGGKSEPSPAVLHRSRDGFLRLSDVAAPRGIRLMTENWHATLSRPEIVNELLDSLDGAVGLCLDFGNWGGETKYDDLAAIAHRAESCHTKAHFNDDGGLDRDDYIRCLDITRTAGFSGPYTLIYSDADPNEWNGLAQEMGVVKPYL
ncbi:MAG TPA: TIM barrel protein [Abditibacteriaceae bacterium]|jgi:sugar phosphate isomerase/epimerase